MTDILIDGNCLFARAWYKVRAEALPGYSCAEESLGLGIRLVINILNPDVNKMNLLFHRALFAWDHPSENSEFTESLGIFKDLCRLLFGGVSVEIPGVEADDILATAAFHSKRDCLVMVVSADKDLMQLIGENRHYFDLTEKVELNPLRVCSKFPGLKKPEHIPAYMAVLGHKNKGILGVDGFGQAHCAELFKETNADMTLSEVAQFVLNKIPKAQHKNFLMSLKKATLKKDIPGIPEPSEIKFSEPSVVRDTGLESLLEDYTKAYRRYEIAPF